MNQFKFDDAFMMPRDEVERRAKAKLPPPYLTVEGFVLIDRRENEERRAPQKLSANDTAKAPHRTSTPDLLAVAA
ncbi:hypothetical protein BH11PSE11_BH11PSE11_38740 [soil metagenome]